MRQKLPILFCILGLFATTSCKVIYLKTYGYVRYVGQDHITVIFECENLEKPDCFAEAKFSKKEFPFAYIGQKVEIR